MQPRAAARVENPIDHEHFGRRTAAGVGRQATSTIEDVQEHFAPAHQAPRGCQLRIAGGTGKKHKGLSNRDAGLRFLFKVCDIYEVIHKNFKSKLREVLIRTNIQNNGGPQHGVVTSEILFYLETIRRLKVLPDKHISDKAMDDIWTR